MGRMYRMTIPVAVRIHRQAAALLLSAGLVHLMVGCASTVAPAPAVSKPIIRLVEKKENPEEMHRPLVPIFPKQKPYMVFGQWYHPLASARGFCQQGLASWYGEPFHGNPTSSGEIYDMYKISAAHKILPLGTYVRVRNLENNRTIDLRINDRGPFVSGRIIDLSYGAARHLDIVGPGTAPVEVVALVSDAPLRDVVASMSESGGADFGKGNFSIQVGAFSDRENAEKLAAELKRAYDRTVVKPYRHYSQNQTLYRVLVGQCDSLETAERYERFLKSKGYPNAFMIAD